MIRKYKQNVYEPKTTGLTYLRLTRNAQAKHGIKFITIPLHKVDELIEIMKITKTKLPPVDIRSNSLKSAAIALAVEPQELCKILNDPNLNFYREKIAELNTQIAELKEKLKSHE
jgi:hypothetical protein